MTGLWTLLSALAVIVFAFLAAEIVRRYFYRQVRSEIRRRARLAEDFSGYAPAAREAPVRAR